MVRQVLLQGWQGNNRQNGNEASPPKRKHLHLNETFWKKQSANPDMTFQALYEIYMEDMSGRLKESSIQHKKNIYETKILPFFFGKMPINEIKNTYEDGRHRLCETLMSTKTRILSPSIISLAAL